MPSYKWDVFISHASEDKESFVRPLAEALEAEGLAVWYDDFALTVGDSLRRSIDHGLSESRYGVVVLSPAFFTKEVPQKELDGLDAREREGHKVILPVWLDITREQVEKVAPMLAGRVAARAELGMEHVVNQLLAVVRGKRRRLSPTRVPVSGGNGLKQEEKELLLAAVDGDGYVLSAGHEQGHDVQAGGRNFTENANPRTVEKYKAALRKLVESEYLEPQGHKNEVFKVSHEGYEAADRIKGEAVLSRPVESPDWSESLERYRQDFPDVQSFISIENVFGREFSGDWDDFGQAVRRSRVPVMQFETFPWTDPPPDGKRAEWGRRRGALFPFWSWKYCHILESGHFLYCSNRLMWDENAQTSVGVRTLFYHLIMDLTYAGRLATALGSGGSGGSGGKVTLTLHNVEGRRLDLQAELQGERPKCTDENPEATIEYGFPTSPDAIRAAAVEVVFELLSYFPLEHDGGRLVRNKDQLDVPARKEQEKYGLLKET